MPERIQLKRTRGFNLQAASIALNGLPAVKVDRTTRWGNPFSWLDWRENFPSDILAREGSGVRDRWCREQAVQEFSDAIRDGEIKLNLSHLRGKNLACWCPVGPCHADVLLRRANRPTEGGAEG